MLGLAIKVRTESGNDDVTIFTIMGTAAGRQQQQRIFGPLAEFTTHRFLQFMGTASHLFIAGWNVAGNNNLLIFRI